MWQTPLRYRGDGKHYDYYSLSPGKQHRPAYTLIHGVLFAIA